MNITVIVIKADVGGYVGHSECHHDVIAKAEECITNAERDVLLVDFHVTNCGMTCN